MPFIPNMPKSKKLMSNSMGFNKRRHTHHGLNYLRNPSNPLRNPVRPLVDTRRDGYYPRINELDVPILSASKGNLLGQTSSRRLFTEADKPRLMEDVDRERRQNAFKLEQM